MRNTGLLVSEAGHGSDLSVLIVGLLHPSEPTADRTNEPMFQWDQSGLSRRSWCDIIFRRVQRAFALVATSTLLKTDVSGPECWLANSCPRRRVGTRRGRTGNSDFVTVPVTCSSTGASSSAQWFTTPLEESPSFAETRPREEPV